MENKKSWLKLDIIDIAPNISIKVPMVGEVLENEKSYYNITSSLTTSPFSYMVQLDDMGIDYTSIDDWELFRMLFCSFSNQILHCTLAIKELEKQNFSVNKNSQEYLNHLFKINQLKSQIDDIGLDFVFKDLRMVSEKNGKLYGFEQFQDVKTKEIVLYNEATNVKIDRLIYTDIANTIRKINLYEKNNHKPGNEHMKKYLLEKERKKQKRNSKKPYKPYLEKMVIALVNTSEFPYDYESCMNLSMYQFNHSLKQIQKKINFDNTMIGVYSGTVDTSKITDKDCLSWFQIK